MDVELKKYNQIERLHWWWYGRRKLIEPFILEKNPKKILEIGCGTGETLSFLKQLCPKAQLNGIDISPLAVEYTKIRNHFNAYQANAVKLPFKENSFDLVLFLDVLEHIKNDQKAVNEAIRVLKNKGWVILTCPSLKFIWSHHDKILNHERRYNIKEVKDLAKKAGFDIYYLNYFNFFLSPLIILIRLITKLRYTKPFLKDASMTYYDIAFNPFLNSILKSIFISEIKLLKYLKYPFGVSIIAILVKP